MRYPKSGIKVFVDNLCIKRACVKFQRSRKGVNSSSPYRKSSSLANINSASRRSDLGYLYEKSLITSSKSLGRCGHSQGRQSAMSCDGAPGLFFDELSWAIGFVDVLGWVEVNISLKLNR